jgi:hypothetical protein
MAERLRVTAGDLVDKLLTSEHADVLRESVAWLGGRAAPGAPAPCGCGPCRMMGR